MRIVLESLQIRHIQQASEYDASLFSEPFSLTATEIIFAEYHDNFNKALMKPRPT
jgi:hypothetical protein